MKKACKLLFFFAFVLSSIFAFAHEGDAKSQIKMEIDRLRQLLKDKPISVADLASLNTMVEDSLKEADGALTAGRVYLSLEKLNQAISLLQGGRDAQEKSGLVKSGLPAFEVQWKKASARVTDLAQEAQQTNGRSSALAVRAMAESAQEKTIPLLEGGRGFANATKPEDGLFYLGQAQGEAEFARFCASLNMPVRSAAFPLRSLLPELHSLQEKTNAAFQPPRSIELHTRFIALNSALKLAGELDASKLYAGALYEYLEAVRHYGMLEAVVPDTAKQSELRKAISDAEARFAASSKDDSLAQLFLQRAESQTTHEDGSAPSADEWRSAQVIIERVLPAYLAAQKPASPLQQASGKAVDITLVRWPYT
jgi:hypothetical protein